VVGKIMKGLIEKDKAYKNNETKIFTPIQG